MIRELIEEAIFGKTALVETAVGRITEIRKTQIPDFEIETNIEGKKAHFVIPKERRSKVGDPEMFRNGIEEDLRKKLSHVSLVKINEGIALFTGGYSIGPLTFRNDNVWNKEDIDGVIKIIKENFPSFDFEVSIDITAD